MIAGLKIPVGAALLAVLALAGLMGLLAVQTVMAQDADAPPVIRNAETVFDYNEHGTGPITTYRATDPEGNRIFWTLGGPDAADFTIKNGVLAFKSPPDYENAKGTEGISNNTYKVTVRYGAGGQDGTTDATDDYDGDDLNELEVTVNVINVDEPGMVVISPMHPQVGTELTAILTDEDNVAPGLGEWQWASSDAMNGPWTNIPSLSNRMTYQPTSDDLGKYLRVTVTYLDRAGAAPKTLMKVSDYTVEKDVKSSNQPPTYPDQKTLTGHDAIFRDATDRFIPETAAAETNVGAPVTAFDDKTALEVITYSLRDAGAQIVTDDDGNTDTPRHSDGDAMSFDIDAVTGQITVGAKANLNADQAAADLATDPNPYTVIVRAVDPDGDTEDIVVTIHVLKDGEAPTIDETYVTGRVPATGGVSADDRVPTEFSHWESDRTPRSATTLDADLDSGVLDYTTDPPTSVTDIPAATQPATYYATDPDAGDIAELKWSLGGRDGHLFMGTEAMDTADPPAWKSLTLSFRGGKDANGEELPGDFPNWEIPLDANGDNVYEVTIVVTDPDDNYDALPVTVKVINSTEDNKPGTVELSNRQPEIATPLTAKLDDPDDPTQVNWQWYRLTTAGQTARTGCAGYDPHTDAATAATTVRGFIADDFPSGHAWDGWEKIDGAKSARYTPDYDADAGGTMTVTAEGSDSADRVVDWAGGDIDVTITTHFDDDTPTGTKAGDITYAWSNPRCLRAAATYKDSVDRTHADADDLATTVNETLEGTFMGSEFPVKGRDENNESPVFRDHVDENPTSVYRALEIAENVAADDDTATAADRPRLIKDAVGATDLRATDSAETEDDASATYDAATDDDILTYSLSGPDAKHFAITGAVDTGVDAAATYAVTADGILTIKGDLDYEKKRRYEVTITATDPSGDFDTVNVIVNLTNVNEGPEWTDKMHPGKPMYEENSMGDVAVYHAADPERPPSGVVYSLVTAPIADDADGNLKMEAVEADAFVDNDLFEISSITGKLRFKESPNYEKPKDIASGADVAAGDNKYQVVVKAEVTDDETPRHFITQAVTVMVTNMNEKPEFTRTLDTLEISENPDDPEKQPPLSEDNEYLYLLNRGVGKPAANLPAAPNLDVGIPMVAVDDDNTFTATNYTSYTSRDNTAAYGDANRPVQLIDGLTYELEGADAGAFHIVPATGQILTRQKLDYETKKEYKVTVKATDPWDASDSIPITIKVTDVDEAPVGGLLTLTGAGSHSIAENATDTDLGIYAVSGYRGAAPVWTLEGQDMAQFELDDDDNPNLPTRTLKFIKSPNYEMPRGMTVSATNTNTYMVTVKVTSGDEMKMTEVTVMVENQEEAGKVEINPQGGKVGTPLTATLSDDDIVQGAIEWLWRRVDAANGSAVPITGARSATYTPVVADAGSRLRATATYTDGYGADTASATLDDPVQDANVPPAFEEGAAATREVAENAAAGTNVGDPITATDPNGDDPVYSVSGTDFDIDPATGQLMVSDTAMLNYEAERMYMVTVTATDPEGESATIDVTVNLTNMDEGGTVSLDPAHPRVGSAVMATVMDPDLGVTGTTWQWAKGDAMNGPWNDIPGEITNTIIPRAADEDSYLRVTANYTDTLGSGKTAMTTTTMPVTQNAAPAFAAEPATRMVAENTSAGMAIGDPVMATDANNDTLVYSLGGADMASFGIDAATGQLSTSAMLDYEMKSSYMVTVMAADDYGASDTIMVTIMVENVDEMGMVNLSSMSPMVGTALAASLSDPDEGITGTTWQWSKSMTMDGTFMAIAGATSMTYTPVEGDVGYYLRATASYTDNQGTNKSAMATSSAKVPTSDPLAKFDTNKNGTIERSEVIAAIRSYLDGDAGVTRNEVIDLIRRYLGS